MNNVMKVSTIPTPNGTAVAEIVPPIDVVMDPSTKVSFAMMVLLTTTPLLMPVASTVSLPNAVTMLSMLARTAMALLVALHPALSFAEMELEKQTRNVITALPIPTLSPMLAERTADSLLVVMVSVMTTRLVIVELTTDGVVAAKLFAETVFLTLERNAMTESTTLMLFPTLAELTACSGPVVMVFWTPLKNVIMEPSTRTPLIPAAHGAESLNVVMESAISLVVKLVMMEMKWMVMVAHALAKLNAETAESIPEKFVMTDPAIPIPFLDAADPDAFSPDVVMALPTLVRNATMVLKMLMLPIPADPTVPFLNAVMVSLIIFTASFATRVPETA
jgi:hypothetical protein